MYNKSILNGCLVLLTILLAGCNHPTSKPNDIMINWNKLPDLPGMADTASLGVSAPFVGISNGKLLVAGGCNFPDKPVTEGGTKKYYSDIFTLALSNKNAQWEKAGNLPFPVAYGASVTTPEGVVCIGGNNSINSFTDVHLLSTSDNEENVHICKLAPLPVSMDNLSATYADHTVYVAGGNVNKEPGNSFFAIKLNKNLDAHWEKLPDIPCPARVQPVLAAQKSADGVRIYLAGGFQPVSDNNEAIVSSDMLSYHPATKEWITETELPLFDNGARRTFTGGSAVAFGDSSILFMGGVNYECFLAAVNRSLYMERARTRLEFEGLEKLAKEGEEYMHHPVKWYKFNTSLLQYDTFSKEWTNLGEYEQLARAGAGAVMKNNHLIIINGELKPGIRTPQVNQAILE